VFLLRTLAAKNSQKRVSARAPPTGTSAGAELIRWELVGSCDQSVIADLAAHVGVRMVSKEKFTPEANNGVDQRAGGLPSMWTSAGTEVDQQVSLATVSDISFRKAFTLRPSASSCFP
jgi:hypothetical protein